jgi:hypothetical protein
MVRSITMRSGLGTPDIVGLFADDGAVTFSPHATISAAMAR